MNKVCAITIDDLPFWSRYPRSEFELDIIVSRLQSQIEISEIPVAGFINESVLFSDDSLKNTERRYGWLREWAYVLDAVGNHTYSHLNLHECSTRDFLDDIVRGETLSRKIHHPKMPEKNNLLFRFPYLNSGKTIEQVIAVKEFLNDRNYSIVPVTIDSQDWIFAQAYDYADLKNDTQSMELIAQEFFEYVSKMIVLSESISMKLFSRIIPQIVLLHASKLNSRHFIHLMEMIKGHGYGFVSTADAINDAHYQEAKKHVFVEPETDWRWYRAMAALKKDILDVNNPAISNFVMQLVK